MKLSSIKKLAEEKAKKNGTYSIEDGEHEGTILSIRHNKENDRVYMKIELLDGTIYNSSDTLAAYCSAPLLNLILPFEDQDNMELEDIKDYAVTFTTKNNESKDGSVFSNIIDIDYIYEEDETE